MRWRNAALTGGTSIAAAAAINAFAARGVAPLDEPLGGDEGWFTWRGHRVAYSRVGEGRPVLLVHGLHAGAWSFEWRHVAGALAAHHTVYALDLLGFGRSDRPAVDYTAALYQQLVLDFAVRVIGAPVPIVAAGVSGAHAVLLAARDAERWPAVVLSVPTGIARTRARRGLTGDALRLLVESPVVGTSVYNALVTRAALRQFFEEVYARRARVTPELVDQYYASSHQPGAKHALAALVSGRLDVDVRHALRRLTQPLLVVWGKHARQTPVEHAHSFRVLKPDARVELLDHCGDLPHVEQPADFAALALEHLVERDAPRVLPFKGRRAG